MLYIYGQILAVRILALFPGNEQFSYAFIVKSESIILK